MGTSASPKHKPAARTLVKATRKTPGARKAVPIAAGAWRSTMIRLEAPDRGEPIAEALERRQSQSEAPDAGEGVLHSHLDDF